MKTIKQFILERMEEEHTKFGLRKKYICFIQGDSLGALEVSDVLEDGVVDGNGNVFTFNHLIPCAPMTQEFADRLRQKESGIVIAHPGRPIRAN